MVRSSAACVLFCQKSAYGICIGICSVNTVHHFNSDVFAIGMDRKACMILASDQRSASVTGDKTDDVAFFFGFNVDLAVLDVKRSDLGACGAIEIALVKGVDYSFVGEFFGAEHGKSAAHIMGTVVVVGGNALYHLALAEKIVINVTAMLVPASNKTTVVVNLKVVDLGISYVLGIILDRPARVVVCDNKVFVTQNLETSVNIFCRIIASVKSFSVGTHEGTLVLVHRPAHLGNAVVYVKTGLGKIFAVSRIGTEMGGLAVSIVIAVGTVEIHLKARYGKKLFVVKLVMAEKSVVVCERNDRIAVVLINLLHFLGRNISV